MDRFTSNQGNPIMIISPFYIYRQIRKRGRRSYHFVDGGLIEVQRFLRTRYFPYLYKRSNIAKIIYIARRCLRIARSTRSALTFLLRHLATTAHLYRGDEMLHSVHLSVYLCRSYTIYSQSEFRRNFTFTRDIMHARATGTLTGLMTE